MPTGMGLRQAGFYDCPGGGQVVVENDIAYIGHMRAPHGTSVVADFVEAPSQMLENWCWTPSVLKSLSQHWETKESIPDDLIEKLVATKNLNSATAYLGQLLVGTFDMTIHTPESHEAVKAINAGKLWNELRRDISGIKGPEATGLGM